MILLLTINVIPPKPRNDKKAQQGMNVFGITVDDLSNARIGESIKFHDVQESLNIFTVMILTNF